MGKNRQEEALHCAIKQGPCEHATWCAFWDVMERDKNALVAFEVVPGDVDLGCLPERVQRVVFDLMGWTWLAES